jgi:hypothetical protein
MPNGTTPPDIPTISPEEFAKSWNAKFGGGAGVAPGAAPPAAPAAAGATGIISPEEFRKSWGAKFGGKPAAKKPEMGILGEDISRKEMGTLPWLAEGAVSMAGAGLGGLAGALLPVPGGAMAGEAAGMTATDVAEALYNQWKYGKKANVSLESIGKDYLANLPGALIGGAVSKYAPGLIGKMISRPGVTEEAEAAGTKALESTGLAQKAVAEAGESADKTAAEAIQKAKIDIAQKVRPEAIEEAQARSLARTAEESRAAARLPTDPRGGPGPEAIARSQRFIDTAHGPKNRIAQEFDKRYEEVFKDHLDRVIDDPSKLQQAAKDQVAYAQQEAGGASGQVFNRDVQSLLAEANYGLGTPSRTLKIPMGGNRFEMVTSKAIPGDVQNLLNFRTRIGEAMVKAEGPDLVALHSLQNAVNETLGDMNVPGAKELRGAYRGFKGAFGHDFDLAIRKASKTEPSTLMQTLFDPKNPQRAMQWLDKATVGEKATMREMFGDAVNLGHFDAAARPDIGEELGKMGFTGALKQPPAWAVGKRMMEQHIPQMLQENPYARRTWSDSMREAVTKIRTSSYQDIVDAAEKQIKSLPKAAGENIKAQMDAAKTVAEKSQVALNAFKVLDPQREAVTAGGQAITGFKPTDSPFYNYLKRRAMFLSALGVPMLAMGHPYMAMTGLLAGTPVGIREGLRSAWLYSIRRSPQAAEQMYKDLITPGTKFAIDRLATRIVDATVANTARSVQGGIAGQMGYDIDPLTAPAPPEPSGPGPMSQAIDRKQAIAMSSERGRQDPTHVDQVQNLNKQIASRSAPNIHHDLASGRLSNSEVRQMLASNEPSVNAQFQGLSLPDAMEAFGRGTQEEKMMSLGALAQKLNDEGRNLPPEQRRAYMAQLRRALPEEGEEGVAVG